MTYFYFDASALGKRYAAEIGSTLVSHLFAATPHSHFIVLLAAIGETLSILVRRRNGQLLTPKAYQAAYAAMRAELLEAGQIRLQSVEDALVVASLPLIERHSINSTDALVLRSALDLAALLRSRGHTLVMVAADARLVRAAAAEGLSTFNPESDNHEKLDALITA